MKEPNVQQASRHFEFQACNVEVEFTPDAERQILETLRSKPIELHTCYRWGSIPCAVALGAADIGVGHAGNQFGQEPWEVVYFAWGVNWSKVPKWYDGMVARIGPGVYAPILPYEQVQPLVKLCNR